MGTTDNYIAVDEKRYDQLIRAEHDANILKAFLATKIEGYGSITHTELEVLSTLFIGKKEEE